MSAGWHGGVAPDADVATDTGSIGAFLAARRGSGLGIDTKRLNRLPASPAAKPQPRPDRGAWSRNSQTGRTSMPVTLAEGIRAAMSSASAMSRASIR